MAYKKELAGLLGQLGANVLRIREARKPDRSQEEVAAEANLHRTAWGKIEAGGSDPRFSTLLIVADTLGVTLNDLAEGIATPKERKPGPPTKRNRAKAG